MKLLVLCPSKSTGSCGVCDYTAHLSQALRDQEIEVQTSLSSPDPDFLLVQYTPSLYYHHPSALSLKLEKTLWEFRKRHPRSKIVIQFHEAHYPVLPNPRGILCGIPQWLHFQLLTRMVDAFSFSYERALIDFQSKNPHLANKCFWLPVGSNITPLLVRRAVDVSSSLLLIRFGGLHPTQPLEPCLEILRQVLNRNPSLRPHLHLIGSDLDSRAFRRILSRYEDLRSSLTVHGYQRTEELSVRLSGATALLAPFTDGVSTRRGTVMAGLAHGIPVLTNLGRSSQGSTPWADFTLASTSLEDYVARGSAALLEDRSVLFRRGALGNAYYEAHFSWQVISQILIDRLQRLH